MKTMRQSAVLLAFCFFLPLVTGCSDNSLEHTVILSLEGDVTIVGEGQAVRFAVLEIDPRSDGTYRTIRNNISDVKDIFLLTAATNNVNSSSIFSLFLGRTKSDIAVPGNAVKVAEVELPGPAGTAVVFDRNNRLLNTEGEALVAQYLREGGAFYVYLTVSGTGDQNVTFSNPTVEATIVYDII